MIAYMTCTNKDKQPKSDKLKWNQYAELMQWTLWKTQIYPNRLQFLNWKKFYLNMKSTEPKAHL